MIELGFSLGTLVLAGFIVLSAVLTLVFGVARFVNQRPPHFPIGSRSAEEAAGHINLVLPGREGSLSVRGRVFGHPLQQ